MKELDTLFEVILNRKNNPVENSYTSYLFDQGLDKILKKCGEECSEMIIAAKSYDFLKSTPPGGQEIVTAAAFDGDKPSDGNDISKTSCGNELNQFVKQSDESGRSDGESGGIGLRQPDIRSIGSESVRLDKQSDLENEICDLIYHIAVLMTYFGIPLENIDKVLKERSMKIGNLKSTNVVEQI